jgi:methylenetetrahydrofolate--tRNA-(uracil-5-)-methyltransferase
MTPAHTTGMLAEIVCSNSLKSNSLSTASGLLKEEMRRFDSLIIKAGDDNRVPAGDALAVDRDKFAGQVTKTIEDHPNIELVREEITAVPTGRPCIIATGPLTSGSLADSISALTGNAHLYFYDAIAPSVEADSIDYDKVFRASRYDKGEAAYLNCPMERDEYLAFWQALTTAELAPCHEFEDIKFFEGCLPIEEIASRGPKTLSFGPLKPVGLNDPRTGKRPWAVVQLRQENEEGSIYGLVGFQTRLKWPEQKRVFGMIPGLEKAEFVRYGQIHRNTYIDSPKLLTATLQMKDQPDLFFAGQIVGVEGYVESAAAGMIAGINAARLVKGQELIILPKETMLGALLDHVANSDDKNFQPMNAIFGIMPPFSHRFKGKQERNAAFVERALQALDGFMRSIDEIR